MPELPEVQTVASELNYKLKNRKIKSVAVNAPKMVAVGPAALPPKRQAKSYQVLKFIKLLKGQKILGVKRRAKLIIINLSPTSLKLRRTGRSLHLLIHLKMTGQFIFEDKKLRAKTHGLYRMFNKLSAPKVLLPGKHTHVIFTFSDASHLYFNDIRKFGYLKLVRDDELDQVKELKEYGPEPLDKKFTTGVFCSAAQKTPHGKIKEVLMDPKTVAGIGNIYSDEILFLSGVRPERTVSRIQNLEFRKIYSNIKLVLKKAIKAKGSSVGDFVRTDGSWGGFGKFHFVYGRKGQKCKKCGTIITSVKLNGRTGSFCPKCQR